MYRLLKLATAALLASAATCAVAETTVNLEVLKPIIMIDETTGEETLVYTDVETATPGERLAYRITLENTDEVPARSIGMTSRPHAPAGSPRMGAQTFRGWEGNRGGSGFRPDFRLGKRLTGMHATGSRRSPEPLAA